MKYITISFLLILFACGSRTELYYQANTEFIRDTRAFTEENPGFLLDLKRYADTCNVASISSGMYTNFIEQSRCNEYIIMTCFLLGNDNDRVIVPILKRDHTMSGKRMENINMISCRRINSNWHFAMDRVSTFSFSYAYDSLVTASEVEIQIRHIRNIYELGFINETSPYLNQAIFDSEWYKLR